MAPGASEPPSPPTPAGLRGRPREATFDDRILEEAFAELARGGISHFSVSAVARRARVAKGTIYLRWPTREPLILDASTLLLNAIAAPEPGPFATRLRTLADQWATVFAQPQALELLQRVSADRDAYPALYAAIFARVQGAANAIVQQIVREAQATGEVDPAIRPIFATQLFVGPLFVEALARTPAGQVSPAFRDELVTFLARALAPADRPR